MYRFGLYLTKEVSLKRALQLGVDAIFDRPSRRIAEWAKEHSVLYVPHVWIFENNDLGNGVVNIFGKRGLYAFGNTGCPSNPRVLDNALKRIENVFSDLEVPAVILDGVRFPSPRDMEFFFSCFCGYCVEKMKEKGINPEDLLEKLKALFGRPERFNINYFKELLSKLGQFRCWIIEENVALLYDTAKAYGGSLWAAVFPPSISFYVGQDYSSLKSYIGEFQVMLYSKCKGPACLNSEISSLARTLYKLLRGSFSESGIFNLLEDFLGMPISRYTCEELDTRGIDFAVLIHELEKAQRVLGEKVVPIIMPWELSKEEIERMKNKGRIIYFGIPR